MPTAEDFTIEIDAQISRARKQQRPHVEINAGELHRLIGGYPANGGHVMPSCCGAMRKAMDQYSAEVIFEPDQGAGASLTIRYYSQAH